LTAALPDLAAAISLRAGSANNNFADVILTTARIHDAGCSAMRLSI
jgi:hypothetical protein